MGRWRKGGLIGAIIVGIAVLVILWRCSTGYYPVDRFAGLAAEPTDQGRAVLISGHVMGSFYCVGRIDSDLTGPELNIRMRPRYICPRQRSGDFEVRVKVPQSSVTRVTYGDERAPVPPPDGPGR
jgi:hypothetical protein